MLGLELLIAIERTQRAKDYPIIGSLARLLPPADELRTTTDPDRVLELSPEHGHGVDREAVSCALNGLGRDAVVVALAREADRMQLEDKQRMAAYARASESDLREFLRSDLPSDDLRGAHRSVLELAERFLPPEPALTR